MKGKFIKKLTAYALTAAMVMSTPLTAFAAEFADNFWVSYGDETTATGTGTVSATETNSTVLKQSANITGIVIKEQGKTDAAAGLVMDLNTEGGNQKTLVAEVQYDGTAPDEAAQKEINNRISWRSSNLSIIRPAARKGSLEVCPITAYKGGFASITAELDVDNDGVADFMARVKIMVKKAPTAISLNLPNEGKLYAGHTYDLMDYVKFGADDEFDVVKFEFVGSVDSKLVTLGNEGILSLSKKIKTAIPAKLKATVGDHSTEVDVTLDPGVPVTGLKFEGANKKPIYDIKDNYSTTEPYNLVEHKQKDLEVKVVTKSGSTTDDITWTSSDNRIVKITSKPVKTEDGEVYTKITFEGLSVGKATVTATATSGKSAKVNVQVKASLIAITGAEIAGDTTYSGKATPIVVTRVPSQNTDKLIVDVGSNKKVLKAKAGINPVITPAADLSKAGYTEGNITVKVGPKGGTLVDVKPFTLKQSNVLVKDVVSAENGGTSVIAKKTVNMKANRKVTYFPVLDTSKDNIPDAVSWASSKETVAKVEGNGRINVVGEGSAKITVSSVYDAGGGKYKTQKLAFTIKSTPKCEEIVLKSRLVAVKAGKPAVITVKQQLPKKAADDIKWYTYKDGVMEQVTNAKTNNKKCTIENPGSAGDVVTVVAISGGAEVEAKVIVLP